DRRFQRLFKGHVVEASGRSEFAGAFENRFDLLELSSVDPVEWMHCRLSCAENGKEHEPAQTRDSHHTILLVLNVSIPRNGPLKTSSDNAPDQADAVVKRRFA